MHITKNRMQGIFHPSQVYDMRMELRRGDTPGERKSDREKRAALIIRRKSRQQDQELKRAG